MRIGILEDNPQEASIAAELVAQWGAQAGFDVIVEQHSTAQAFLSAASREPYQMVLLDCYLDAGDSDVPTGMDVARILRAMRFGGNCAILFTTSSMDFAVEGYEVGAVGYLVKPLSLEPTADALSRAVTSLGMKGDASALKVALKTADGFVELAARNIVWARSSGHYIDLVFVDGQKLHVRMTMRELAGMLEGDSRFFSPARGYLVNLDEVAGIQGYDFILRSDERVPISQTTLTAARAAYAKRTFERMGD